MLNKGKDKTKNQEITQGNGEIQRNFEKEE